MNPNERTVTLPWPPSVNGYWRSIRMGKTTRQIMSARGRLFRDDAKGCIWDAMRNGTMVRFDDAPVTVSIDLHPPTLRRYDLDNYAKAILDALAHAGVIDDDSQVVHLYIRKMQPVKAGKASVTIAAFNEVRS